MSSDGAVKVLHPAKFSPSILDVIRDILSTRQIPEDALILDPFAGVGRCHELGWPGMVGGQPLQQGPGGLAAVAEDEGSWDSMPGRGTCVLGGVENLVQNVAQRTDPIQNSILITAIQNRRGGLRGQRGEPCGGLERRGGRRARAGGRRDGPWWGRGR